MKGSLHRIFLKPFVLAVLGLGFGFLMLLWFNWANGYVVAVSSSPQSERGPTIKVRSIPSSRNPIWMAMPIYTRYYRCEYYATGKRHFLSSQTFSQDSYIADGVEISWTSGSDATVYFDGLPALRCIRGWWTRPEDETLRISSLEDSSGIATEINEARFRTEFIDMPVVMESEVSKELEQIILRDLHLIFNYHEDFSVNESRPLKEFSIDGEMYSSDKNIYMTGPGRRLPKRLGDHFGRIIIIDGTETIVISDELISEYRNVMRIADRNPTMLQKLGAFIDDLNDMTSWPRDYDRLLERFYLYQNASQIKESLRDDGRHGMIRGHRLHFI